MFSVGAWRFAAVQLGGIAALYDLARAQLVIAGRSDNPHQLARMGIAAMAVESARLWVFRACALAQNANLPPAASVAYVNMARLAVERAGLDVLELTHRSVGLSGFLRPSPIERISRDLATYLRQPAPDEALCDAAASSWSSIDRSLTFGPRRSKRYQYGNGRRLLCRRGSPPTGAT
jgi:alkylation response protein AidB-like acyl-CoA dehydrogenase